jgi:rRNA-processing protein FCF1
LKLREESISRLARTAISFIDECFKSKDEYLLGQNAIESSRELIEIDSGDDYIINCALQMKEFTSKIIVLSNDKNLRNKAFVNHIEAFSSDMLNYADYNFTNKIKFE